MTEETKSDSGQPQETRHYFTDQEKALLSKRAIAIQESIEEAKIDIEEFTLKIEKTLDNATRKLKRKMSNDRADRISDMDANIVSLEALNKNLTLGYVTIAMPVEEAAPSDQSSEQPTGGEQ